MDSLESEPAGARKLDEPVLADAIRTIGFECTRWGACCKAAEGCGDDEEADGGGEPHTAAVFPEEFRRVREPPTPTGATSPGRRQTDSPTALRVRRARPSSGPPDRRLWRLSM